MGLPTTLAKDLCKAVLVVKYALAGSFLRVGNRPVRRMFTREIALYLSHVQPVVYFFVEEKEHGSP